MQLIHKNEELTKTLSRLITDHSDISFAVAWASSGSSVFKLLEQNSSRIKRAIIGTHFYQTHPDVLDTFLESKKVRFVLQPSGVFHPKIYLFRNTKRWDALIGSANLTNGALEKNSEAMLLIGGTENTSHTIRNEIESLIDQYWELAKPITKPEAIAYRERWNLKQPTLRRLSGQYGTTKQTNRLLGSLVMSMNWSDYLDKVKKDKKGFQARCTLLETVSKAFKEYDTFASMDLALRKAIAGLPNDREKECGWFGNMNGAGYYHQAINKNSSYISSALDQIPRSGLVAREHYNNYVNEFTKAFPNGGNGIGVTTRLLTLKRPDQFVCLDSKNMSALCKDFDVAKSGMSHDRYWDEVIERIIDSPWWNSTRPTTIDDAKVWDGRAAMIDAIYYRD